MKMRMFFDMKNLSMFKYREIISEDNKILEKIIKTNLEKFNLNIPGTAYFDESLKNLSEFYLQNPLKRAYYVLLSEDKIIGGVGLAEFENIDNCCELQKLYLIDEAKGHGLGYFLIKLIESKAHELGYKKIYLETHTNLSAAIHIYEKFGYEEIKHTKIFHQAMNKFYIKDVCNYFVKIPVSDEVLEIK